MAAEISLLSVTRIQKFSQSQNRSQVSNPNSSFSWMWNNRTQHQEDDDSWEVRAFAEDTARNAMGSTWPPRSYTCTFCRREFRSAQALGGHMNVHRRDRARLHQLHPPGSLSPTSSFAIPAQEFVSSHGGLCLFYHLQSSSNRTFSTPTTVNACPPQSPSTFVPISPHPPNNSILTGSPTSFDFLEGTRSGINSSYCSSGIVEESRSSSNDNGCKELDLELRLGHRPTPN